jgi:hypothetical protein
MRRTLVPLASGVMRKTKEVDIQRAICDYLALKKHFFWRNNNTPIFDATAKRFRAMPKYSMMGLPDIIVLRSGKFIGIEVKREKGNLSDHQHKFAQACVLNGGDYIVARSIDDVVKIGL